MNLLSVKRPQVRLAGLMLGIALIALALGGTAWFRSAWPEVQARRRTAARHEADARFWRRVPAWVDDPCLLARRNPILAGVSYAESYDVRQPYVYSVVLHWYPQDEAQHEFVRRHRGEILALCRDRVAYHERMRARWALAAWVPWSDPGPDEPVPPIAAGQIPDPSY